MSICTFHGELSISKHASHELVGIELGFFVSEEIPHVDIEFVAEVLQILM